MHKITATQLFDGYKMHTNKPVIVFNSAQQIEAIIPYTDAGDNVQSINGLVTPGLINAHCHIELSNMHGVIEKHTGLPAFLKTVFFNRNINETSKNIAIKSAIETMQKNGIVAVGDICNTTNTINAKSSSPLFCKNFIEATGFLPTIAADRFEVAKQVQQAFINVNLNATIVPHAPYSISAPLAKQINNANKNTTITYHNQECQAENELYKYNNGAFKTFFNDLGIDISFFKATNKNSLPSFLPYFNNTSSIILVHNTCTNNNDIAFAKTQKGNLYWCLCPNANLYIENKLPDVNNFVANNLKLVIGTDSLASNDSLCIKTEVKTLQKYFPNIDDNIWLTAATLNGAKALGINTWAGSFEVGKTPGFTIW